MAAKIEKKRNSVEFLVYGDYALFSDPLTRVGGEKFSYPVPTYEALKGIISSVYWKPSILWRIDRVRVVNKIMTEGKGIRPIKMSGGNDLAYYTYLKKVAYQVLAYFEFNQNFPHLKEDHNEHKHHNIAMRMIERGGRRDVFLGTRECQAYVVPCEYGSGDSFYDGYGQMSLGHMLHSISYPEESGNDQLGVKFWHCVMNDGEIVFPHPNDQSLNSRSIREYSARTFELGKNLKPVQEEENELI